MPLYEYECTTCHRRTEKIQKFSDPELTVCPFCSGALERTITAAAFSFQGGGWYKDGYGSAKPAPSADSGAPASGPSLSGDSATAPGTPSATAAAPSSAPVAAPSAPAAAPSTAKP